MIMAVLRDGIRAIVMVIVALHHRMVVVMLFHFLIVVVLRVILRAESQWNHRGQRKRRYTENDRFPGLMTHGHCPFVVREAGDYERRQGCRNSHP